MYELYQNLLFLCLAKFGVVWMYTSILVTERISARNRFYPQATIGNINNNVSLSDCAILCYMSHCLSFYYKTPEGRCVLQRVVLSSDDDVFAANWTYFEKAGKRSSACNYNDFFLYNDETSLCFKLHKDPASCSTARAVCASEGANLISIDSQHKLNYVKKVLEAENELVNAYIIGGFYDTINSRWIWENDSPFNDTNWINGITPGGGYCVTMVTRLDFVWNAIANDQFKDLWSYPFLCERN